MKLFKRLVFSGSMLLVSVGLAACGGGGTKTVVGSSSSTVSGVVSKGPVSKATVKVFGLDASGKKIFPAFANTSTSSDGSYKLPAISYAGAILVETSGGTYKDEATGETMANPGLKAVLPNASGAVTLSVTPLTHVAFRCISSAGQGATIAQINKYNTLVRTAFGVDITNTKPVDATDAGKVEAAANDQQVNYGVMLAAVSKMGFNNFLSQVSADMSAATPTISNATGTALTTAITDVINGGIVKGVTTDSVSLINTINTVEGQPIVPPQNLADVDRGKAVIQDLRDTALALYDYKNGTMTSVVKTPFDATAQEIETRVKPELASVSNTIGWALNAAAAATGDTQTITVPGPSGGSIIVTSSGDTRNFVIKNAASTTISSGTITVASTTPYPTSASVNATVTTPTGTATVAGSASASFDTLGRLTGFSFNGNFTTKDANGNTIASFSCGSAANKISATFAYNATSGAMYPTSLAFNGEIKTTTIDILGSVSVPVLVYNNYFDAPIPTQATVKGTIKVLNGNGLTLDGTLAGTFNNAATFNPKVATSSGNFPNWSATFNGSVTASNGLNISSTLTAKMSAYQRVDLTVQYLRTKPDGTTVFLAGSGSYLQSTQDAMTLTMTNQNGMVVTLNLNQGSTTDFTGTIKTSGGVQVARIYMIKNIPTIKYSDNYIESIL